MMYNILDFDNLEEKKIELEILEIDKEIHDLERLILYAKEIYLKIKIQLIEDGFTEEDFRQMIKKFNEEAKSDEELNEIEESFYSKDPEHEGKLLYSCDPDSENYHIFIMCSLGRYLKIMDIEEDISKLRKKKIRLHKKLIKNIETERKYKELLNNDE